MSRAFAAAWRHFAYIVLGYIVVLPILITAQQAPAAPAFLATDPSSALEEDLQTYLSEQDNGLDGANVFAPVKMARSMPAKFDPTYRWLGIGKRNGEPARPKFNNNYKYIGLGKKRDSLVKYNPNYKWIGLGKRYAPFAASSQMLAQMAGYKELFHDKNRISRTSAGSTSPVVGARPWKPFYSVVTKKYQSDSSSYADDDARAGEEEVTLSVPITEVTTAPVAVIATAPTSTAEEGRPNVRGGAPTNYEPIYRFIGLG